MASKRKKGIEEFHPNLERWMISYADFLTLLFSVFVLLYAISQVDQAKLQIVAESISRAFAGPLMGGGSILPHAVPGKDPKMNLIPPIAPMNPELSGIEKQLRKSIIKEKLQGAIIRKEARGIIIELSDTRFFDSGSDQLRPQIVDELKKIIESLKDLKYEIRVEGHTDNVPINTVRFPSNWELSAARAMTVLRFIRKTLPNYPQNKLSVAGYGEFRPIADNNTKEGRDRNRRVDIVILSETSSRKEPKR